jgi:hypothetical protein
MHVRGTVPLGTAGSNVKCAKKSRSQSSERQYSLETTRAIFTAADHWKKRSRKTFGNGFLRLWKGFPSLPYSARQRSSSNPLASRRSAVSKPSMNQP